MKDDMNNHQKQWQETEKSLHSSDLTVEIWQKKLFFITDHTLFSPHQADSGTMAMLAQINLQEDDYVLDLGCGYGLVGLAAASKIGSNRVVMVDINELAVQKSRENARLNDLDHGITIMKSDGLSALENQYKFTKIISNPPYHTDFSVAKRFIEDSHRSLESKGQLWLVVKRLDWYRNKMRTVFGGVRVMTCDGYYVLMAEKRSESVRGQNKRAKEKKPPRKHLKKIAQKKRPSLK